MSELSIELSQLAGTWRSDGDRTHVSDTGAVVIVGPFLPAASASDVSEGLSHGLGPSERLELGAREVHVTASGWPLDLVWARVMVGDVLIQTRVLARIQILDRVAAVLVCAPDLRERSDEARALLASIRPRSSGVACVADFYSNFAAWPTSSEATTKYESLTFWAE